MLVTQLRLDDSMLLKRIQTAELLLAAALLSLVFQTALSQSAIAVSGNSLCSKSMRFSLIISIFRLFIWLFGLEVCGAKFA
jgi:hypothetical protein